MLRVLSVARVRRQAAGQFRRATDAAGPVADRLRFALLAVSAAGLAGLLLRAASLL